MKLLIISGSQRKGGLSTHVANRVAKLAKGIVDYEVDTLELLDYPEILWNEHPNKNEISALRTLREKISSADTFAIITPEYGGMAPPLVKNFFLQCSVSDVGYKPALLIAVSAGQGGAYPIFELRGAAFKNNKINFIPDHVIIRDVEEFINNERYKYRDSINARLLNGLKTLDIFGRALLPERNNILNINASYPYGM